MTKAEEIKKIEAVEKILVPVIEEGTTYISEIFGKDDFLQMANNIQNDFPLEYATKIGEIIATKDETIEAMDHEMKKQTAANEDLSTKLIAIDSTLHKEETKNKELTYSLENMLREMVINQQEDYYDFFPIKEVIQIKMEEGVQLEKHEQEFVLNCMK